MWYRGHSPVGRWEVRTWVGKEHGHWEARPVVGYKSPNRVRKVSHKGGPGMRGQSPSRRRTRPYERGLSWHRSQRVSRVSRGRDAGSRLVTSGTGIK